jgi:hypothetical protein
LPWLLRPPLFFKVTVSDFSGLLFVISANVGASLKRCPGVVGFNFFTAISFYLFNWQLF